jgi:hypothetical protein
VQRLSPVRRLWLYLDYATNCASGYQSTLGCAEMIAQMDADSPQIEISHVITQMGTDLTQIEISHVITQMGTDLTQIEISQMNYLFIVDCSLFIVNCSLFGD